MRAEALLLNHNAKAWTLQPPLWNSTCSNDHVWSALPAMSVGPVLKSVSLVALGLAIVGSNFIFVAVLRDGRYRERIHEQVRSTNLKFK